MCQPLNKKEEVEIITQKLAFNLTSVKAAMDELGGTESGAYDSGDTKRAENF